MTPPKKILSVLATNCPRRVQIEYLILLMDDVKSQIEPPTSEAMEEFYSTNIQRFQTSILSDPNDTNSEKITQTRSFAEVVPQIRKAMENDKSSTLAGTIFNEIKDVTEAGFEEITFDEATIDQLQMAAGDYQVTAEKIDKDYHLSLMTGKTGWLSPEDLRQDKILSGLTLQQQQNRIPLSDMILAASSNPKQTTRRIGIPTVRPWQNIGPIRGGYYDIEKEKYYPLMAMVRVVGIREAAVPETVDIEYDTKGVALPDQPAQDDMIFSLKEKVKEDVLLQKAMVTAKARAEELAGLVEEADWDKAITRYNEKYAADEDPNDLKEDTQWIKLTTAKQQTRASQTEILFAKQYMRDNPAAAGYMQQHLVTNMLNNRLYDMLTEDSESTGTIHRELVFEPAASVYVIKNITRQPATLADYLENKANTAMQLGLQDTSSLVMVHFSPKNIVKRMNYKYKDKETPEETPAETTSEDSSEE